jgi:prepilin-type N-terminal cleavage/methylation domain-containing protein
MKKINIKNQAFTLIELMAVVIILGIITTITVTSINYSIRESKNRLYVQQVSRLEEGVKKWAVENTDKIPTDEIGITFFSISRLKDEGIVDTEIVRDPRTNTELNGCMTIKYDLSSQQYDYKYEEESCSLVEAFYEPIITVVGGDLQYAEVNGFFEFPQSSSVDYNGRQLEVEGPIIYKGTNVMTTLDLAVVGDEYRLVYESFDDKLNLRAEKEVVLLVRDTVSPVIRLGATGTVVHEAGQTFNFPTLDVSDNSCGLTGIDTTVNSCNQTLNPSISATGFNNTFPATYPIYYTATDSSGNNRVAVLNVVVQDTIAPTITSVTGNPTSWQNTDVTLTVNASDSGSNLHATAAYSFNGGTSWQASNTSVFTSNQTVEVRVRDAVGNIASSSVVINRIDKAVPTITSVTGNPTSWQNTDVTLTVNASDSGSNLHATAAYSFNGGTSWQASNTSVFTSNQTVEVRVRDAVGNIASSSVVINRIDKAVPTITSVTGNPTTWQNTDVTLTVNASDSGSNLHATAAYSFNGGTTWQASNTSVFTSNQTVEVRVRDAVGNIASSSVVINRIDKTEPTITSVTGNPTSWQNTDVTLTVNASDSGSNLHATAAYSFNGGTTWQASNTSVFTSNQTVEVRVRDVAGNIASSSVVINRIDKTVPTITSVTGNPTSWQNTDVTLTVNASDSGSNLHATAAYSFNGGTSWQASNTSVFTSNQTVEVRVRDAVGNIASSSVVINRIDKAVPTITSVTGNPTSWQNTDVTLTVNASDSGSNLHATAAYSFNGGTSWQAGNTAVFTSNQTVEVRVRDAVGNIASSSVVINRIDKTEPTITSVTGNPTSWQNTDVTLTVNASDSGSNLHATAAYSFNGGTSWQAGNTAVFTSNQTVEVRVRDVAGNIASSSVVINRIDKTAPTISVGGNPTSWQNTDVTLTVTASDAGSGLHATAAYSFNGGTSWQAGNTAVFTSNQTVEVRVRDVLGNTASSSVVINRIDKTAPSLSYSRNGSTTYSTSQCTTPSYSDTGGSGINGTSALYVWSSATTGVTPSHAMPESSRCYSTTTTTIRLHGRVCDNAGNCIQNFTNVFYVDVEAPSWVASPTNPTCVRNTTIAPCGFTYIYRLTNLGNLATDTRSGLREVRVTFGGYTTTSISRAAWFPSNSYFTTTTLGTITRVWAEDTLLNRSGAGTNVTGISCSSGGSTSVCSN